MNVINLTPINAGINSEIGEVVENGDIINGDFITIELLTRFLYTHTVLYPNNYISCNFEKDLHGAGSGELILRNDVSSYCDQSQYIKVLKTSFNAGIQTNIEVIYFGYIDRIQEKDGKVKFLSIANLSQLYSFNFTASEVRRGLYELVKEATNLLNECVRFNTSDSSYPFYVIQSEFNNWQVVGLPDNPQVLEWNEKSISDILKNDFIVRNGVRRGFLEILPTGKITINEQENIQESTPDFTFNIAEVNYTKKIEKNTGRFQESGNPNIENYNEPLTMISITPQKVIQDIHEAEFIEDTIRNPKFSTLESGFVDEFIDTGQIAEIKYTRKNPYNTQEFSINGAEVIIDDQELLQNMESEDGYSVVLHDSTGGRDNIIEADTRDIFFKIVNTDTQVFIGLGLDFESVTYTGKIEFNFGSVNLELDNGILWRDNRQVRMGEYNPSTGCIDITLYGSSAPFANCILNNVSFSEGIDRNIQSNTIVCSYSNKELLFSEKITQKEYNYIMYRSCISELTHRSYRGVLKNNGNLIKDGLVHGTLNWETMEYIDLYGNISFIEIYNAEKPIDKFNLLIEFQEKTSSNILKLDLSEPIPLRDKLESFGVEYAKENKEQTSGAMKTAPLEYVIKIPTGYKITKIQYYIDDYRSVNPYFYIVYNRSIFQVVKMIAELVKYRIEGGKILSKAIFNGTQDKIF